MGTWSGDMARAVSGRAHTGCPQPCPAHPALLHIPSRCGQDGGGSSSNSKRANARLLPARFPVIYLYVYLLCCLTAVMELSCFGGHRLVIQHLFSVL